MRIGIEAQRIFRPHKHGMDIVVLEVIRQLQQLDKENEYVIFVNEGQDTGCLAETSNFRIVQFSGSYPVWEQVKLPRMAEKYGCDILHCTSNTAPLRCKVPMVVTIHDIIYLENSAFFKKDYSWYQRLGNVYRSIVVRKILSHVLRIITVSHFEAERFKDVLRISTDKLDVIYNGVSAHFFSADNEAKLQSTKAKYGLPEKYMVFLGNTDPKKNTRGVLEAYARYCAGTADPHKLVVADLDEEYALNVLRRKGLDSYFGNIHFTGYIPNRELPYLLAGGELFLYPSLRESFGIPILEAMASGTPVITSDAASMPEVAGGAAVLVDPNNVAEISRAIAEVLENAGTREKLARKGRQRAAGFTWRKTAEQTQALYMELLKELERA